MKKKKGKRPKPYRYIPLLVALALFACTMGCKSDDAIQLPIRGTAWSSGPSGLAVNANMIVAGGEGSGGASLELLGMPWKSVAWDAGKVFVGRVKPKYRETFGLATPLPAWVLPLFPQAVLGTDGLYRVPLSTTLIVTIEGPSIMPAPPPDPDTGP